MTYFHDIYSNNPPTIDSPMGNPKIASNPHSHLELLLIIAPQPGQLCLYSGITLKYHNPEKRFLQEGHIARYLITCCFILFI